MGRGITNRLFKGDKIIWMVLVVLFALSFVEVFSATSRLTYKTGNYWGPITQHVKFMMIGGGVVWIAHNMPLAWLKKLAYPAYIIGIILLVWAMFFGTTINGESRWIRIFGLTIQASEVAKLGLLMAVAKILGDGQSKNGTDSDVMRKVLFATGLAAGLIVLGNLSTALLICFTVYLMLFIGKIPARQMWRLTGACAVAGTLALGAIMLTPPSIVKDTPMERIITWQNRIKRFFVSPAEQNVDGKNKQKKKAIAASEEQRTYANLAIASSNIIFGKGPGNSEQREFLPHAYSDFIYAIIIEELGWLLGGVGVILLYLTLLYHTGQIAKECDDPFATYLSLGAALMIVIHALVHMSISVGLGPVTGQPLPLVSQGGSSIAINCAYIGMIISISRYAREVKITRERAKSNATAATVNMAQTTEQQNDPEA